MSKTTSSISMPHLEGKRFGCPERNQLPIATMRWSVKDALNHERGGRRDEERDHVDQTTL